MEFDKEKQRAERFDALGHPIRIRILEILNQGSMSFADLKRILEIDSSGHLKHHLDKLNNLIKTGEDGKYCLSSEGRDALLDIRPIEKYNEDARMKEQATLLLSSLWSDFKSVREIAIVQLSLMGQKAVPYLTSTLSDHLEALNKVGGYRDNFHGELAACSGYPSCSKRDALERTISTVIQTLGVINDPNTIDDIAKALPRNEAFTALGKIGNKRALKILVSVMPDYYEKKIRGHDRSDEDDSFLRNVFAHFDAEEVRSELENLFREGNESAKNASARILGVVGDSRSFPVLTEALTNPSVTIEAVKALQRLKAIEAVPKMIDELFKSQNRDASETIAKAVLELGGLQDLLLVSFHRPKVLISTRPFDAAIIQIGEKAVPELAKLFQDPDSDVQREAAEMVAKIKRGEKLEYASFSDRL